MNTGRKKQMLRQQVSQSTAWCPQSDMCLHSQGFRCSTNSPGQMIGHSISFKKKKRNFKFLSILCVCVLNKACMYLVMPPCLIKIQSFGDETRVASPGHRHLKPCAVQATYTPPSQLHQQDPKEYRVGHLQSAWLLESCQ